ncbi:ATP-binding domain-containing protein [Sorangium sp. So ce1153]|uniref:ATP-binding domain-containing protein n=1 Tax=Sorangium sp. So ce1153 TaxID=3133333 RepID=UPI003F628223
MAVMSDLLAPEALRIVREEEDLLSRALASLAAAREKRARASRSSELRSVAGLRALRDEASSASVDDLPALLLEMSVRQRLLERPHEQVLPDPASPYVAHLRLLEEGGGTKDYLLGHASFVDVPAGVRIVDWRVAPIAKIFYRYRQGDPYEEVLPNREVEGVVQARRVVVVERGVLTGILCDGLVLTRAADGSWRSEAPAAWSLSAGGAGAAARPGSLGVGAGARGRAPAAEITALLDADQFAAVSAPAERPLLVLGSAGSGKTTVALHRLSRIAAAEPRQYPLSRMKLIVPEPGLARLSTRLLEPLGASAAQVRTLDDWALELARQVFGDQLPKRCVEPPALVSSLKRHPALYRALLGRFEGLKPAGATLKRLRRKLAVLFTDRPFLEAIVADSGGALTRPAVEETVRHTMLQLAEPLEKELKTIVVPEMKKGIDGRPVWEGVPDELAGTIDVEDLAILLFLRALGAGIDAAPIAHLTLDEAEDFSLFELFVLGKLLGETRSVTLAGDEAQQTSSSFAGWPAALSTLGVGASEVETCRLATSYRCPEPVVALARRLLGALAPEAPARAAREGAPVGRFHFPEEGQANLFLLGAVRDLAEREPLASIALIAHSADGARQLHALAAETCSARLVLDGQFSFEPGIDVTDLDNAKGLEFDYVIVTDASAGAYPGTDEARRRLHVAVTRTSHQLWIVSSGRPSPLLLDDAAPRGPEEAGLERQAVRSPCLTA